jgi:hypothetical protein
MLDCKSRVIVPLYKRLCEDRQEKIIEILVKDFGIFLFETRGNKALCPLLKCSYSSDILSDADVIHLITFYQFCAVSPNGELRAWCAYNFPVRPLRKEMI